MAKTYGQFCGLARALDHVGDRWTLLIVRELLLDDRSYGDLLQALDGIPTNLLADRLRELEGDGLVTRVPDEDDRRRALYSLTPAGRALEPALLALIRWGAQWMRTGPGDDRFDDRWAALALRALLDGRTAEVSGTVEVHVGGERLAVVAVPARPLAVARGVPGESDAVVDGAPELVLAVVSGDMTLAAAARRGLRVRRNRAVARALLQP